MVLRNAFRVLPHALLAACLLVGVPTLAYSDNTPATGAASGESSGASGGSGSSSASQETGGGASSQSNGDTASATGTSDSTANAQGGGASAGAETTADASASVDGDQSQAASSATAGVEAGDSSIVVEAEAEADFGNGPNSASASTTSSTGSTTSASAVRGVSASANASDPNGIEKTKVNSYKTVAIAINPDGSYSVAITTRNKSFASAGVYGGDYTTFSARDIMSAVRAAAGVYAKASKGFAEAGASSRGAGFVVGHGGQPNLLTSSQGYGPKGFGWASVTAKSKAYACAGRACVPQAAPARRPVKVLCQWSEPNNRLQCPHFRLTDAHGHPYGDPRFGTLGLQ